MVHKTNEPVNIYGTFFASALASAFALFNDHLLRKTPFFGFDTDDVYAAVYF
jgi:hypothetical protein